MLGHVPPPAGIIPALISQISNLEFVPRYFDIWIFAPPDGIPGLSQDQLGRGRSRQCDIYIISLLPSHNHHHHCPPKNKTRNINYNCLKSTLLLLLLSLARRRRRSGPMSDLQNCPQTLHKRFKENKLASLGATLVRNYDLLTH